MGDITQSIFIFLGEIHRYFHTIPGSFIGHKNPHKGFKQPFAFHVIGKNSLIGGGIARNGILG